MKKLLIFFLSCLFILASSASAIVYKWVDQRGVVNFADDYSKVPPDYRNKVEEVNITRMGPSTPSQVPPGQIGVAVQPGEVATQAPPIAQTLIREGDFAIKLAEALKIGQAKSEAEAEDMLASVSITPKNGWIADYPMTPGIIGELQSAVGAAVDSGKLRVGKNEAITALLDLAAQQGLPVRADTGSQYAGVEPTRDYGEYARPEVINNYYYDQGPPVVTYYPPPWDYYYLYAWVPYPFWCSGFLFPGFFILNDFHIHHGRHLISNHFIDPKNHASLRVDPTMRTSRTAATRSPVGKGSRGFASPEARKGATSIFNRGLERSRSSNMTTNGNIGSLRSQGQSEGKVFSNPGNKTQGSTGRSNDWSGSSGRSFSPSSRSFSAPRGSSEEFNGGGLPRGYSSGGSTAGHSFGGFSGGHGGFSGGHSSSGGFSSGGGGFHGEGFSGGGFHGGSR